MTDPEISFQEDRNTSLLAGWKPTGVNGLEPAAWDALRHEGCASVTAGPGAGKTEFLAQRAAYLLETETCTLPRKILAISFKRDSAVNLARRVSARVPEHADRFVSMTFDAFSKGLLDRFAALLPEPWQFHTSGYDLQFWNGNEVKEFFNETSGDVPSEFKRQIAGLDPWRFLPDVVGSYALPHDPTVQPSTPDGYAALQWWRHHHLGASKQVLDFVMINRLAELTVRNSPALLRAIRATYPYVFVDEFQDTTSAQITFLETLFCCPEVKVTAVGDNKQRIMGFAGAVEGAMQRYETAFNAKQFNLLWNFRSSPALVAAQHGIAFSLDSTAARVTSMAGTEPEHEPLTIWTFENAEHQARHLADWISDDIETSPRTAADFVLVARQKVADLESALVSAFAEKGLTVRNDDSYYGKLRLQDLLKHDLTQFLLGVLQLSVQDRGQATVWMQTLALLRRIVDGEQSEASARTASEHLDQSTYALSQWIQGAPMKWRAAGEVVSRLTSTAGIEALTSFVRSAQSGDELEVILESFSKRMEESIGKASNWANLVQTFRAEDAVALMTIHRSKGLEFHTVLFLGLDDEQWWSINKNPAEAVATFFVGFSRAGQRLIFTTFEGSQRQKVKNLYGHLADAGARITSWEPAVYDSTI